MQLLKGGAIAALYRADVKIYTSIFESNTANGVSGWVMVKRNFLNFLLCPGAPHGMIFATPLLYEYRSDLDRLPREM
jgi:hypothetical protein